MWEEYALPSTSDRDGLQWSGLCYRHVTDKPFRVDPTSCAILVQMEEQKGIKRQHSHVILQQQALQHWNSKPTSSLVYSLPLYWFYLCFQYVRPFIIQPLRLLLRRCRLLFSTSSKLARWCSGRLWHLQRLFCAENWCRLYSRAIS